MDFLTKLGIIFVVVVVLGVVGWMDYQDHQQQGALCEQMVKQWEDSGGTEGWPKEVCE